SYFVNDVEVLHVAHVNVDPADVVEGAAGLLDRGFEVLADLARLRLDVADTGDAAVGPARGHARNEHQFARGNADRVREMTARLAKLFGDDLLFAHRVSGRIAIRFIYSAASRSGRG